MWAPPLENRRLPGYESLSSKSEPGPAELVVGTRKVDGTAFLSTASTPPKRLVIIVRHLLHGKNDQRSSFEASTP